MSLNARQSYDSRKCHSELSASLFSAAVEEDGNTE
jgi:hypothetical protein